MFWMESKGTQLVFRNPSRVPYLSDNVFLSSTSNRRPLQVA